MVTRVFYLILRYATGLDVKAAMYFNVLLASLTLVGLWRHVRISAKVSLWYLVPVSLVIFSIEQWENILWGWQIAIYAMVCSSVWALYWLSRRGGRSLVWAVLAAIVASFAFANGLMIWPAGAIYLILARRSRNRLLAWCGSAVVILLLYFTNYVTQVTRPAPAALLRPTSLGEFIEAPLSFLTSDPVSLPKMVLGNIGAFLAPQSLDAAVLLGAMIVVIFVICLIVIFRAQSAWEERPLSLVAVALLSFLSSLTIIGGRMGFWDPAFVLTSRYTTITLLGIVATYLLTVVVANHPQTSQINPRKGGLMLCGAMCLVMLVGIPTGYQVGMSRGIALKAERLAQLENVRNFEMLPDEELAKVYAKPLRERLLYWKSHNLVPFRE